MPNRRIVEYSAGPTEYEVGLNHFFKGRGDDHDGDIIYFKVGTRRPAFMPAYLWKAASVIVKKAVKDLGVSPEKPAPAIS